MTKFQLFYALAQPRPAEAKVTAADGKVYLGIIQAVEREDGSGRSFNVRIATVHRVVTVHVRTID